MYAPSRSLVIFLVFCLYVLLLPSASGRSADMRQDSLPTADFGVDIVFGCGPFLVQLINYSSPNAETFHWDIVGTSFPNPGAANPIIQLQEAGAYEVQLVAMNSYGADTLIKTIDINGFPEAKFSYDNEPGSLEIRTNNLSVNAFTFEWSFGDGGTSTQTNPIHSYSGDGAYPVRLIAYNDCGQDTFQQDIHIVTPPQAGFFLPEDTVCAPFTIMPVDTSSANTDHWHWSAPGADTTIATQPQPAFTYDSAGQYTIVLKVSNEADSSTVSSNLFVIGQPRASFVINYSEGDSVIQLSNTSEHADTYQWQFGDNHGSHAFAPAHTYGEEGTYEVRLIAENQCGSDTALVSVEVIQPPKAGFELSAAEGCAPFSPLINNTASSNTDHWFWNAEGALPDVATGPSPTFVYSSPGTYQLIQTVSNELGSRSDTATVTVKELPEAHFDALVDGATVAFNAAPGNAEDWEWDFGDGNSGTGSQTVHVYESAGFYDVLLAAGNECGEDSLSSVVKIEGDPPSLTVLRTDSIGCVPLTVQFSASNTTDSVHHWRWWFPGGSPAESSLPEPAVTYFNPGVYPVRLIASNPFGDGRDSLLAAVRVMEVPRVDFTADADGVVVEFGNESSGGYLAYLWSFGDGNTSTAANPEHTYADPGQYMVQLAAANMCGTDQKTDTINIAPTASTEAYQLEEFSLYPNPVKDQCRVRIQGKPHRQIELQLFSMQGQRLRVQAHDFRQGQLDTRLDMNTYAPGTYLLVCERAGQLSYRYVLKQ